MICNIELDILKLERNSLKSLIDEKRNITILFRLSDIAIIILPLFGDDNK